MLRASGPHLLRPPQKQQQRRRQPVRMQAVVGVEIDRGEKLLGRPLNLATVAQRDAQLETQPQRLSRRTTAAAGPAREECLHCPRAPQALLLRRGRGVVSAMPALRPELAGRSRRRPTAAPTALRLARRHLTLTPKACVCLPRVADAGDSAPFTAAAL